MNLKIILRSGLKRYSSNKTKEEEICLSGVNSIKNLIEIYGFKKGEIGLEPKLIIWESCGYKLIKSKGVLK